MNPNAIKLAQAIGYDFDDEALFKRALTHRSVSSNHNERLEFLGDSVLNFVIAAELFKRFPAATEGELSRSRASLVKEDTLADIARDLKLGDYIILGSGELKSGGYRRASILSDTLEAIIGSVYRDGGFEAAEQLILRLYLSRLEIFSLAKNLKDPKTQLQEFLQSRRLSLPEYEVVTVKGAPHNQSFTVECHVDGLEQATVGTGSSRRKAEQQAASLALSLIKKLHHA